LARFWQQVECIKDEPVEKAMAMTAAVPRTLLIPSFPQGRLLITEI
jgi:hypothetical protein